MPCPEKFMESLPLFGIPQATIDSITAGDETITSKSPKKQKAAFFKRAIDLLDAEGCPDTVRDLLAWNACCKSGARARSSKEFARINAGLPLEEKLAKLRKAPYLNTGAPCLEDEHTLRIDAVAYVYEGKYACACANFRRVARDYPVSRTYCFCCGGHFQFHYEQMLGRKLALMEVVSSPLDTDGREPCAFRFRILPEGETEGV